MEVTVTLHPQDVRALLRCLHSRKTFPVLLVLAIPLGIIAVLALLPVVYWYSSLDGKALIAGCTLLLLGFVAGGPTAWLIQHTFFVSDAALMSQAIERFVRAPWRLVAGPTGIQVEGASFSAFYRWSYFPEIIQTGSYHFLFTGKWEALIVPRHAFVSDQAFLDFGELCRRYFDHPDHTPERLPDSAPTGITTR